MNIKIVLFKGRGLVSKLIKWQTRGHYSHAGLLIDGDLYEAWEGVGVRLKSNWTPPRDETVSVFDLECSLENRVLIRDFVTRQLGKGYDYLGVLRFVTRTHKDVRNRWFCSELVYASLKHGNVHLFNHTKPWEVSPDMLKRSPFLRLISNVNKTA